MKCTFLAIFLIFASCYVCEATVSCPSTNTSPLRCLSGSTYSGFNTAWPWCQCSCTKGSPPSELKYIPMTIPGLMMPPAAQAVTAAVVASFSSPMVKLFFSPLGTSGLVIGDALTNASALGLGYNTTTGPVIVLDFETYWIALVSLTQTLGSYTPGTATTSGIPGTLATAQASKDVYKPNAAQTHVAFDPPATAGEPSLITLLSRLRTNGIISSQWTYPVIPGLSCNQSLCSFYMPSDCGTGTTVTTTQLTYAQVAAAQRPTLLSMSTPGVCLTYTLNCTQEMNNSGTYPLCNSALIGTSQTLYGGADASSCANVASHNYSYVSGYGCNTNKCNLSSPSTFLKPSVYLVVVAAAASVAAYF